MLTTPGPESIRKPQKVVLVDRIQHCHHGALDDFVFQRGDAQRALLSIRLGNISPSGWLRPVGVTVDALVQVCEIGLQMFFVIYP